MIRSGSIVDIPHISSQQFATRFALRPQQYSWLLGAGASASGRIPTGYDMIVDFKTRIFCEKSGVPRRELDPSDPLWNSRIDEFLAKLGNWPRPGDVAEYARAFEAVYPRVEDRRAYIAKEVQRGSPSFAHRVLGCLLVTGQTPCVFTTNFDNLIESAATVARDRVDPTRHKSLTVAALDAPDRAERCLRENDWPLLAKIHGDFQSVDLKNTEEELRAQDVKMRNTLVECTKRFALVVVGYSGRDVSVMSALNDALVAGGFPGGIFWVSRSGSQVLPAVQQFLHAALANGLDANVVVSEGFDELAGDIADAVQFDEALERHIRENESLKIVSPVPLPVHEARKDPILRCSALRVLQMPSVARRVVVQRSATITEVRALLKDAKVGASVAIAGRDLAAFGSDEGILAALAPLGPRLAGEIAMEPGNDSWALGLLYDAFVRAVCRGRPLHPRLKSRGHRIVVSAGHKDEASDRREKRLKDLELLRAAYGGGLSGKVNGLDLPFSEALELRLEQVNGKWWCVFDAFTNVDLPRLDHLPRADEPQSLRKPNPAADWLRERWARRYNSKWAEIIAAWSQMLSGESRSYWLETGQGIDAVFEVGSVSAWSRPSHDHPYFHRTR